MKVYKTTQQQRDAAKTWRLQNKERHAQLQRAWRARNKDRIKEYERRGAERAREKRLGLSAEQVAARIVAQGGCAVCGVPRPRGKNKWHVDHDHTTGKVRGVLCITCNIALGMLHDDAARCRAAADYLDHHAALAALL